MPSRLSQLRWYGPLFSIGLALFGYGGLAFAQGGPSVAVSYEALFQVITGALFLVIGGYAKGLGGRMRGIENSIDSLRTQQTATQLSIATDHHTKVEANQHHQELKSEILALHRRLDYLQIPSSFPKGDRP